MSDDKDLDFDKMVGEAFPQKIVTNWIIVAETMSESGQDLHIATSDHMSSWLAQGMINCAGDIILTNSYSAHEGDTDEESQ